MSKTEILKRVQNALGKNHIPKDNIPYFKDILKYENVDLIEEYKRLQSNNRAKVLLSEKQSLGDDIQGILEEMGSKKILYSLDIPFDISTLGGGFEKIAYDKDVETMRSELFGIDTSIIKAVCGVANLGIIGIVSTPSSPRLASLITPNCLILLDKNNIVSNLFEGTEILKKQSKNGVLPTNMLFIAGPSRTADIELQTVFGVHGPQNVAVILY
ncbi:LutC/YkgG family protein [Helicobacter cappadocius]|uniref:Lactate utilization protein C n=1 Tax=Helicobacter cappadocius TaxID=3063998 RepID=A0AA90PQG3_9HELI|nr:MULTISPECIES: lactate utilization protein C [unclassified Helicobacter]MDO7252813.1 lactate utilization protein C [Helicobacter sp. faydin-H75]MDP2538856.1 lactate utilization protein C [Helicobacter sp. faydin-H76]